MNSTLDPALNPAAVFDTLHAWFVTHVWTLNTMIELGLILSAFVAGLAFTRMMYQPITGVIERVPMPIKTKRFARHARRAIFPLASLLFMFVVAKIMELTPLGMHIALTDAVIKVLLAWVLIRVAFQFVENSFVRNLFTWSVWLVAALSIFGVINQTAAFLDSLGFTAGTFRISLLEIIKSALLLMMLLYLSLFASAFFERKVLKSKSLTRSTQVLIVKIIRLILVVLAIVVGIASSGIDLSVLAFFSGAIGLGIGFGLQRSVSNLFCGLLLLIDQSIKPGDVIELDTLGTYGWVNQMAARYVEVVTRDNKSYLIPNEDFVTQRVVNWSHGDSLVRLDVHFGAHYDSDPHHVIKVALEAVRKPARVVHDPSPVCFIQNFGDSAVNFKLRFWIRDAQEGVGHLRGEVYLALWDAFKTEGIRIPYPQREVFMHDTIKTGLA